MRICWVSNSPKDKSGYGQQSALAVRMLKELGHYVVFFTNHRHGDEADGSFDYPIYSASSLARRAYDGLADVIEKEECDMVILLVDAWVFGSIDGIEELERVKKPLVKVLMSPVDCLYLSPLDAEVLLQVDELIAMSEHAHVEFQARVPEVPSHYLPLAIDSGVFNIDESAKTMWKDHLIVGMVQANVGTRKQIPHQLEAISLLKDRIPNMVLMMHMDVDGKILNSPYAINYMPLIEYLGLTGIAMSNSSLDLSPEEMSKMYNRFDLLLNTSSGEGFGVPIVEAMACGVQPVVTNNSSMQYFDPCIKVEPCIKEYASHILSYFSIAHPKDIADAVYNWYVGDKTDRNTLRDYALRFDKEYIKWNHWEPFIRKIHDKYSI